MERLLLILGLLYLGIADTTYGATVSITTASLPNGTTNQSYSYTVTASGGTLPYTWSASNLPAGLSINSSTGVISGTPTCGGANSCDAPTASITVQDSVPNTAKATFPFSILNDITDTVVPVATATPLQQIAGDMFQILNPNYQSETSAYGQPTNGLYSTQAGVWGMDEGVCTLFPNNSEFCIYGDTITVYWDPNISGTHCAGTPGVGCWQDFQFIDTCQNNGPQTGGSGNCLGQKAMSLTAGIGGNPPDYSTCGAIAGVDTGLTNNVTPTISYAGCPNPTYITNSSHSSAQPRMASQSVSGLIADADGIGEVTVAGHTPDAALVVGGNLYIEWNMTRTPTPAESGIVGGGGYLNESVWLNCGATSSITTVLSAELPCSRVSTWSQAPYLVAGLASPAKGATTITAASGTFASYMSTGGAGTGEYNLIFVDGDNQQAYSITSYTDATHIVISPAYSGPGGASIHWSIFPNQETNIGKFINSSSSVFTVTGLPWASLLPSALQSASQIVCSFGSSFAWRASNFYLMCFDAANVNGLTYSKNATRTNQVNGASGGITQAYYLTGLTAGGIPSWTQGAEQLAIPLLHTYQHTCLSKFVPS